MLPAKNSMVDWEAPKDLFINSLDKPITKNSMTSASTIQSHYLYTMRIFAYSIDLFRRKDAWTHNMNLENKVSELQNITLLPPQGYNAIGEILGNKKYPSTFRLISRIVDFYPLKPEEFVELRCSSCQEEYAFC